MSVPLVTICMPLWNAHAYLREAIESVLSQSFVRWTLLISDNASTDGSCDLVTRYQNQDSRIHLFTHQVNSGMVPNWQYLLEKVDTPYFCFVGADDILYPHHLLRKLELLETHSSVPFVHGAVDHIDSRGNPLPHAHEACAELESTKIACNRFISRNFVNVTSVLLRTEAVSRIGKTFDLRCKLLIDWQLFTLLSLKNSHIAYDPVPGAAYRLHSTSVARKTEGSFEWALEERSFIVNLLEEHREDWKAIGDPDQFAKRKTLILWRLAFKELRAGRAGNAAAAIKLFRKYNGVGDILTDLPRYVRGRIPASA